MPTLDLELKVEENKVIHRFYEKPTTAKVTVQERSAMEERAKMKILSNDLTRRMLNMMVGLEEEEKLKTIDRYGQKLLNSGFSREKTVDILVAGLRSYQKKVARCRRKGQPLYRTSKQSAKSRQLKKLVGSKSWYRMRRRSSEETDGQGRGMQGEVKEPEREEEQETRNIQKKH